MRHRRGPRAVPPLVPPSSSPAEHWLPDVRWQNTSRGQIARIAGCGESQCAAIACAPPQEKPGYDARRFRVSHINGRVLACAQRMPRDSRPASTATPVLSHMRALGECGRSMICAAAGFAAAAGRRCFIFTPVQARGRYCPTHGSRNKQSLRSTHYSFRAGNISGRDSSRGYPRARRGSCENVSQSSQQRPEFSTGPHAA